MWGGGGCSVRNTTLVVGWRGPTGVKGRRRMVGFWESRRMDPIDSPLLDWGEEVQVR